ncbi:lipase family protein [Streptomyces sp. PTM05]|uniref:Lipase family protein n=1 Tax=Streptantibioticus parmotrematis TaxID=2873249 RepID=A0ABS7QLM9_9ACTN|nr:lipase family protein [Streptantibioticus parmotrematis]MBY8884091.1 lipase family protein [Streptantibioticus parmotrematis]
MTSRAAARRLAVALVAALAVSAVPATSAFAASPASAAPAAAKASASDPFYSYDGSAPLASYQPGAVLKRRTLSYHIVGIPTPLTAIQLLYRTTDAQGRPAANVTTVLRSLTGDGSKAVSYQSFYDSLNPQDGPSRAIAGDLTLNGIIPNAENLFVVPLLAEGYNLVIPDTEGQSADFAAGPEYATNTLDSIRAATSDAASTGMDSATRVGLMGYSGGAIATSWAAALAPSYAPDVNRRLVGFAEGGLLVDAAHNLKYVDGSLVWSGVIPMAIIGVARSYGIDLKQYMSSYGVQVYDKLENGGLLDALGHYPGLTWAKLAQPQYANPDSIPDFVKAVNAINLGSAATPTIPGLIAEGDGGVVEGTFANPAGIGTGDGVMVAGDVRALTRQYCATGNHAIDYQQYDLLSHITTAAAWAPGALGWLNDRFAGKPAPSDCGSIAAGNSLAPEVPTS